MMLSWNVKCPVGILKVLLKEGDVLCFDDIVVKISLAHIGDSGNKCIWWKIVYHWTKIENMFSLNNEARAI